MKIKARNSNCTANTAIKEIISKLSLKINCREVKYGK
jgi:hypothetical protein